MTILAWIVFVGTIALVVAVAVVFLSRMVFDALEGVYVRFTLGLIFFILVAIGFAASVSRLGVV